MRRLRNLERLNPFVRRETPLGRPFRIAYGRIAQETNSLSPVMTEISDFKRTHFIEGHELHWRTGPLGAEAPGFIRRAELSGFREAVLTTARRRVEALPLMSAWAVPGGPLSERCYDELVSRLLAHLELAWPVDAVFLSMHGAMGAIGRKDPDGDLLETVRAWLDKKAGDGPRPLIAVTLDLHAALTTKVERNADILCAYRTNPHRDHASTGRRAGKLLIDRLAGDIRPTSTWRSLPMVMGGGMTLDFLPPMRKVFALMKAVELWPGVLDVNLFMCHPWNDHPELGWAVHVTTDNDPGLADRVADHLAEAAWSVRHHGLPSAPTAEEAIVEVREAKLLRRFGTACVCDVSDVVGAGATGENTRLIRAFMESGQDLTVYAPIRDAAAIESLWSEPLDKEVELEVGGRLHPELNPPLKVRGRLVRKLEIQGFDRVVRLDCGHLQLAITEGPPLVMKPGFYRALGLEPLRADVCVVKSFFPFRIFFALENRKTIYARTRGVTDFSAIEDLELTDRVHPMNEVADWRPVDQRRRSAG